MTTMEELAPYMRGWRNYFGFCETLPLSLAGSGCDCGLLFGATGKHHGAAGGHHFKSLGLPSLFQACYATSRTAGYGPVRTVVWEGRSCEPPSRSIDLSRSILVGDKLTEIEAGSRAGVGLNILVTAEVVDGAITAVQCLRDVIPLFDRKS
jgi:hypothetical protein